MACSSRILHPAIQVALAAAEARADFSAASSFACCPGRGGRSYCLAQRTGGAGQRQSALRIVLMRRHVGKPFQHFRDTSLVF